MFELLYGSIPPFEDILSYLSAYGGMPAGVFGEAAAMPVAFFLGVINMLLYLAVLVGQNRILVALTAAVCWVMNAAGRWGIFRKAGRSGLWALVPVAAEYQEYAICWKGSAYIQLLILLALVPVLPVLTTVMFINGGFENTMLPFAGMLLSTLCAAASFVMVIVEHFKLSKAFGRSALFAIGLLLFRPLMILILGMDQSQYCRAEKR